MASMSRARLQRFLPPGAHRLAPWPSTTQNRPGGWQWQPQRAYNQATSVTRLEQKIWVEPLGVAQRWAGVKRGLDLGLLKALSGEKSEAGQKEPN